MHILLTNDDGISSAFLRILAEELHAAGHSLTIAAPAGEQSWISRAVSRRRVVSCVQVDGWPGNAWAIDGTPTDCINIALGHLVKAPPLPEMLEREIHPESTPCQIQQTPDDSQPVEMVISGINVGMNCSTPFVLASGTVAGALEGAFWGLPAIAISQYLTQETFAEVADCGHACPPDYVCQSVRTGARIITNLLPEIQTQQAPKCLANKLPGTNTTDALVHNINFPFPCQADSPLRLTEPGGIRLGTLYKQIEPGKYSFEFNGGQPIERDQLTDRQCVVEQNAISYTRINYSQLGRID